MGKQQGKIDHARQPQGQQQKNVKQSKHGESPTRNFVGQTLKPAHKIIIYHRQKQGLSITETILFLIDSQIQMIMFMGSLHSRPVQRTVFS
jgi:hypothetical protein